MKNSRKMPRHSLSLNPSSSGIVVFFIVACALGHGQITNVTNNQATPTPGVGHDYIGTLSDIVSPSNGSLSLRIEVPTPKGRGVSLAFQFSYNSSGVIQVVPFGDTVTLATTMDTRFLELNGWGYGLPLLSAEQTQIPGNSKTFPGATCPVVTGFVFTDPAGTRHSLGLALPNYSTCNSTGIALAYQLSQSFSGYDGSYFATVPGTAGSGTNNVQALPFSISDNSGTYYHFPSLSSLPGCTGYCNVPDYIEDRNGNKITITAGSGSNSFPVAVTDTAGRPLISIPSIGSTLGDQVTISGSTLPYIVKWTIVPHNMSIPLTPVTQNNSLTTSSTSCRSTFSNTSSTGSATVVSSIELPNLESYQFEYDGIYGLLNRITYPTGAYVRYVWGPSTQPSDAVSYALTTTGTLTPTETSICQATYSAPAILHRYVSYDGQTEVQEQDFKYETAFGVGLGTWSGKKTTITTTDLSAVGDPHYDTVYTYLPQTVPPPPDIFVTAGAQTPVESTTTYNDITATFLRTISKSWTGYVTNPVLAEEDIQLPGNLISKTVYHRDSFNNVTQLDEYDFNKTPQTRTTVTQYQTLVGLAPIVDRPCKSVIHAGVSTGTLVAETDYLYDGGTTVCGAVTPSATSPVSGLPGGTHDETNFGTASTLVRGNATTVTRQCFTSSGTCANPSTVYAYDKTGQATTVTDARGNTTTYSYADTFPLGNSNSYLTGIKKPTVGGVTLLTGYTYNYPDGQLASSTDENGQTTTYTYADPLDRLTNIQGPPDPKNLNQSPTKQISYNDSTPLTPPYNPTVTTKTLLNTGGQLGQEITVHDPLGHVIQTQLAAAPSGTGLVDTSYDGFGNVGSVSNPYVTKLDATYGTTVYKYDALGRKTLQTQPDLTTQSWSYASNVVTFQDEVTNQWQRTYDGLGRLTTVMEPNGSTVTPTMKTDYAYDTLDNLVSVQQWGGATGAPGSVSRSFTYNSLSQLITATNPESGTISYTYDPDGNLATKTDARNIKTTFTYDALNRLTQKAYSDGVTLPALFGYDAVNITMGTSKFTISNSMDRPSWTCVPNAAGTGCSVFETFSYDSMGRVVQEWLSTPPYIASPAKYTHTYSYDLGGRRSSNGNSTGRIFNYSHDAAGRLYAATHTATVNGIATTTPMVSSVTYFPNGQPQTMTTNTGTATVTGTWGMDKRMRVTSYVNLSTANSGNTNYGYTLTYTPNGNVKTAAETVYNPGVGPTSWSWLYNYDTLNRLANSKSSGAIQYGCQETYDAWGNRRAQAPYGGIGFSCTSSTTPTTTGTNRLSGFAYDAAGNLLYDGLNTLTYDAEGRVATSHSPIFGVTSSYIYDAYGQRVSKIFDVFATDYVRDQDGSLLATYVNGSYFGNFQDMSIDGRHFGEVVVATGNASQTQNFSLTNWLGSQAAYTSPTTGVPTAAYLSQPFGDAQTTLFGSNNDDIHFTGKERDTESGNDYFDARYYSSNMGRFMSPDPLPWIHWQHGNEDDQKKFVGYIMNPQNFNMYAYVLNNPLNHTDPTGMNACGTKDDSTCNVTVTIRDRSKDANGKYNDSFTGVANQGNYNASAVVSVNGKDVGTFLVKTTPSDSSTAGTLSTGVYSGTLTEHNGHAAIRLQPTDNLPTNGANPAHGGAWFAQGILVHQAGVNNFTGVGRDGRAVSAGCQVVCTSQYGDFMNATGMSASPPQRHFTVDVDASANQLNVSQ